MARALHPLGAVQHLLPALLLLSILAVCSVPAGGDLERTAPAPAAKLQAHDR